MDWGLEDIKPSRGKFTWTNRRSIPGHIATRLDRILVSSSILDSPFLPVYRVIVFAISYHRPILFSLEPIGNLGIQPFKFSPVWISEPGFYEVVARAWGKFICGSPGFIWEKELANVKNELKEWKKGLSRPGQEKTILHKALEEIQDKIEQKEVTKETLMKEREIEGKILVLQRKKT